MSQCNMCRGTGKMQTVQYLDGEQVYMTTDARANEAIYKDRERRGTKVVDIPCNTCKGSRILPIHLEPAYWQGQVDAAEEELDRNLFVKIMKKLWKVE